MKAVYLDTTPLYATVDKRDQNHGRALALFERLEREGIKAHCPLPTVLELHRLLITRKPADPGRAHAVAQWTLDTFTLALPTEEHISEARACGPKTQGNVRYMYRRGKIGETKRAQL